MHTSFIRTPRDSWTSTTLSMFMLLILALGLASLARAAHASEPMIDSIVVKFRDGALVDPAGGLTDDERAALMDEIHTPFSHVGYARDGALRLQLSAALPLDAARAAVNRVRMLPQVLYANIVDMTPVASDVAAARRAAAAATASYPPDRQISRRRDHRGGGARGSAPAGGHCSDFRRSRANRSPTSGRCQAAPMSCACSVRSPSMRCDRSQATWRATRPSSTSNRIC